MFPTLDERLDHWGRLASWAEVKLFEWVESDVPPEEYNELAEAEQGNREIPEHLRHTGRARETLFELVDETTWRRLTNKTAVYSVLLDGTPVSGSSGTFSFTLDPVELDIDTSLTAEPQFVSIFINGISRRSGNRDGFEIPRSLELEIDDLVGTDTVRVIKYQPDEFIINQRIEDGTIDRRVEHTTVPYIDEVGQSQVRYYFWVENKVSRNQNQLVSPANAQIQLTTIPTPYIVTGNAVPAETRLLGLSDQIRSWEYMLESGDETATPFVYQIGGQTETDYTNFMGGNSNSITGYNFGDVITMANGMKIRVDAISAVGDVTEFTVLVGPAQPATLGVLLQQSVETFNGQPTGGLGFAVVLDGNTSSSSVHHVQLSTPIKNNGLFTTLIAGQDQTDFANNFTGGSLDGSSSTEYTVGTVITLTNNATVIVDAVDASGDVTEFHISSVGDTMSPGDQLFQAFTTPLSTNEGFALFPDDTNTESVIDTDLLSIELNNKLLIPEVEYTVDVTGRTVTILQAAGPSVGSTVSVSYTTNVPNQVINIPERQTDIVIRGLRRYVNEDRRYTVRFTRDFTLRDNVDKVLADTHEEWRLFREQQAFRVPEVLWNRLTESVVGFKLDDPQQAVPALNRVLYDEMFQTDTQYGLRTDQSFTNGPTAIQTITNELLRDIANTDTDINAFFADNSFDTPEDSLIAMTEIYNTFDVATINRIFFATLHDALSFKVEYPDILKTSMIAVFGIRPFQVDGLFDD